MEIEVGQIWKVLSGAGKVGYYRVTSLEPFKMELVSGNKDFVEVFKPDTTDVVTKSTVEKWHHIDDICRIYNILIYGGEMVSIPL